jgi:CRP-like cAMP-binding protein
LSNTHQILIRKLREHSRLTGEDLAEINALGLMLKELKPNEDLIRQGDDPDVSAVVVSGMVARYHLLQNGVRQYLSFHMAGDMPDSQALFIDRMDHAVCAIGPALIASIRHKELLAAINRRPSVGFAIWRETLIDAAIFREAITIDASADGPSVLRAVLSRPFNRLDAGQYARPAHQPCSIGRNTWNVDSLGESDDAAALSIANGRFPKGRAPR